MYGGQATKVVDKECVTKLPCDQCGSSDALQVWKVTGENGSVWHNAFCFRCNRFEPNPPGFTNLDDVLKPQSRTNGLMEQRTPGTDSSSSYPAEGSRVFTPAKPALDEVLADFNTYPIRAIEHRGLLKSTCEKYGVRVSLSPHDGETILSHKYPYYKAGRLSGYKERIVEGKVIYSKGDCTNAQLFGSHCARKGGKQLFITEGECFKPDAEVLTPAGWVAFKDYNGEPVAQYHEDGSTTFVDPLARIKKPFKGNLVRHSVKGYTSLTTPGHNLVALDYKNRLIKHKASEVPSHGNTIPRVAFMDGEGIPLTDDQIALTIAVCADSKIDKRKTMNDYAHFGLKKSRKVFRLVDLLLSLNIDFTENWSDDGYGYFSFTLPDWIKDKKLPEEWIGQATLEQRKFILNELIEWDGNRVPNRNQTEFSSKHYDECKWVQTMAHTAGMCSSIIHRKNGQGEWYKTSILHNKTTSSWQTMKTEDEYYEGDVHCVTVPTGMILVRINEHISISGNCDAMALYQILKSLSSLPDWEPAVVSLSHGSASAARDISNDMDFVDSFERIVLCFDQDEAGQRATEDACKLLAGKVYIAKFSEKDPNDMLLSGKAEELKWEVLKHAKRYTPDSIVNYADCWDRYKNAKNKTCYPFPESWKELNTKTYGVREGELVLITSGSGMGKTQFMRELKHHYHETTDFKFADIALEEDLGDTMAGLISLRLNKRISLPDVPVTEEEEREAFEYYFKDRRWDGYDHFGGMDDDNLFNKLRFYAASGHKMIFLDHLSIIVSEYAADGGERERIDTIMTKLAKMAKELGLIMFLVVHLRKTSGTTSFEEGAVPSLDDLRGSGSLKQLSMTIIALSRNQQHHDPFCANTTLSTVLKCRFTGRTGASDYFYFNDKTGRMAVVPCPPGYHPDKRNQGGRANLSAVAF